LHHGFTLIEVLISLAIALLIISILFELFIASQRTLQQQLDLSRLITRAGKMTAILRNDIHKAEGNVRVIDNTLIVNEHVYFIDKNNLVVLDASKQKIKLVEEVSDMKMIKTATSVDVSAHIAVGSLGKTIHVFTALK
jgi:prepilin-type N-terminal cleavage/methylation domain-containing protein